MYRILSLVMCHFVTLSIASSAPAVDGGSDGLLLFARVTGLEGQRAIPCSPTASVDDVKRIISAEIRNDNTLPMQWELRFRGGALDSGALLADQGVCPESVLDAVLVIPGDLTELFVPAVGVAGVIEKWDILWPELHAEAVIEESADVLKSHVGQRAQVKILLPIPHHDGHYRDCESFMFVCKDENEKYTLKDPFARPGDYGQEVLEPVEALHFEHLQMKPLWQGRCWSA